MKTMGMPGWLAVEPVTLDVRVVSPSTTLSVEMIDWLID